MKSITGVALLAAIALCALVSVTEGVSAPIIDYVSTCSDDGAGDLDVDIDIEVSVDLVEATTIIFNTIYSLLIPLLLQLLPLVSSFLELLAY